MSRYRRDRALGALLAAAAVALCASCAGASAAVDGGTAASCAYRVEYGHRQYADVPHARFEVGERLGPAVVPPCDDTPNAGDGPETPEPRVAYAVKGIDPRIAITLDDAPEGVLFVAVDAKGALPAEVRKLIRHD
ncbi:DUF6281 family protein [Streptomyces sp. NPDC047024]|uniref:DUF6281 family protein n=1 Tax=Streptomyces sp. NPDC047024 TaxID=3155476 RepID=UPI0033E06047